MYYMGIYDVIVLDGLIINKKYFEDEIIENAKII